MRVDNGEPFGNPKRNPTTPLAMWLIANDIDMIFNKPYCPQMNGKVEKMQDTTSRWAEISKCKNIIELQGQLNKEIIVQRTAFKVTRLGNKTRLEAFPELETTRRVFKAEEFDAQRVYNYLATKTYPRLVSSAGQITHFGHKISGLQKYKQQYLTLKLNEATCSWEIFDTQGCIKVEKADYLSPDCIMNMTVFQ